MKTFLRFKKPIALLVAALLLFVAYYGTYLPLRKSQAFIMAMRDLRRQQTFEDVRRTLVVPLMMPSPIGQEELVRNVAGVFLNILQGTNDPGTISQIIDFMSRYYQPVVDRGRGMSFGQNLYMLGAMNEVAFIKTKQVRYLEDAKRYYSQGLELGPKRPQPLYGLFDIYRLEGNVEKAKEIHDRILSQWPDDERTQAGLAEFLEKVTEFNAGQSGGQ